MSQGDTAPAGLLPSWREGETRASILAFLDKVDQIPPDERVAVFDNDGTMWAEKPNYTQLEFWLLELKTAVARVPGLADKPEFRAILDGDHVAFHEFGLDGWEQRFSTSSQASPRRPSTPRSSRSSPIWSIRSAMSIIAKPATSRCWS